MCRWLESQLLNQYLNDHPDVNKNSIVFPLTINDSQNAVLSCPLCHQLFDSKDKHIRIAQDGTLVFDDYALEGEKYKKLRAAKAKVAFADKIDKHSAYPSSLYLDWAMKQLKTGRSGTKKKKKREAYSLGDSDDEAEDEKRPKKKPKTATQKKPSAKQSVVMGDAASPSRPAAPASWTCKHGHVNAGHLTRCGYEPAAASGEAACRERRPKIDV